MTIDLQYKINSDMNYLRFLREHPYWYKRLNRDPGSFNAFVREMKDKYELKPSDRINKLLNNITLIQSFLDVIK